MKLLVTATLAITTIAAAATVTPAMAQRVVIGPGGVGIGIGARPYGERLYGGPGVRRGPVFEGRSAYREPRRGGFRRY